MTDRQTEKEQINLANTNRICTAEALREAQQAFAGVADELGIMDDDDVMKLVCEARYKQSFKCNKK